MRFEKHKINHYFILLFSLLSFVTASVLYLAKKRKNSKISLLGHKLVGNIEEFIKAEQHGGREFQYITFSFKDYKLLSKSYQNILCTFYPTHILKVLSSEIIISSHGIIFHRLIKKYFKIKTFYTGHAIKSNNHIEILAEQEIFDEVWLFSDFEKRIYIEECNYSIKNLISTGYPRIDSLSELVKNKSLIKDRLGIDSDVLLYAPTDDRNNSVYKNHHLSPHNIELYKILENIGEELKLKTLIKYHINTHVDIKILKFIENSNNLLFFDKSKSLPDITPLSISDLLITDWSSVFVDYLISNNPILFLDTPMAYNISGVSKVFNNKHISRINSFEGLIKEIRILHEANFKIQQPLRQLKNDIYEGKFDNDNLGRCLKRLERNL